MSANSKVEGLLEQIRDYLDANYPRGDDVQAYAALTQVVPGVSIVTMTWIVKEGWLARIKQLYADAAANCTYVWTIKGLVVNGNEITWTKAVEVKQSTTITLVITNTGIGAQVVDVVIEGWARLI